MKLKLKELRKKYTSYTQAQMAKELNIAQPTYIGYENGLREPNLEMISKIADIFGCTIDELFGRGELYVKLPQDAYNRLKISISELDNLISKYGK